MTKRDEAVGYGRPPVSTRFKPGQCGNPKRIRRQKALTIAELLEKALCERAWITEGGQRKRISIKELITSQLGLEAAKGNARALKMLLSLRDDAEKNGDLTSQIIRIDKRWKDFN